MALDLDQNIDQATGSIIEKNHVENIYNIMTSRDHVIHPVNNGGRVTENKLNTPKKSPSGMILQYLKSVF